MAKWLNRTVIQAPRNGTTSHTVNFTAASAGNYLVAVIEGPVTHTISGWTKEATALNFTELAVFAKTATAGESSFTVTHNGSNYAVGIVVYEFLDGTTWTGDVSASGVGEGGANPNLTGLTGTNLTFGTVGAADSSTSLAMSTAWSGTGSPVEDVDVNVEISGTDGYLFSVAYVEDNTATSFQPTATITGFQFGKEAITFAVNVATTAPPPTITLRAAGTPTGATAAVTAVNPAVPTGTTTGDMSILAVAVKPQTSTVTTPSGWTAIGNSTTGGASRIYLFARESATPGAIGNLTIGGSPVSAGAVIHSYQKTAGTWDISSFTTGGDSASGTNYSATGAAGINVATKDWVIAATGVMDDIGTLSAINIGGMAGATEGTETNRTNHAVTTGTDCRLIYNDVNIASGSSNSAPTFVYTNASATTGSTIWLRLRAVAPVDNPKLETLTDDFTTDDRATKWPASYGTNNVSGGVATVTANGPTSYNGLATPIQYSLVNSYIKAKVTPVTASGLYGTMTVKPTSPDGTDLAWYWGSNYQMGSRVAWGFTSQGTDIPVVSGTPMYLAIAEGTGANGFGITGSAGTTYFFSSTNGTTWTQRHSLTTPSYVGTVGVVFEAGEGSGTMTFDEVNTAPAAVNYDGTLGLTGTGTLGLSNPIPAITSTLGLNGVGTTTITPYMRDVVFRQPIHTGRVVSDTVSIDTPHGAKIGDVLLYVYHTSELTIANSAIPAGFTNVGSGASASRGAVRIGMRVVDNTDLGKMWTFSGADVGPNPAIISLVAIRGADAANMIGMVTGITLTNGSGTALPFPVEIPTDDQSTGLFSVGYFPASGSASPVSQSVALASSISSLSAPDTADMGVYMVPEYYPLAGVTNAQRNVTVSSTSSYLGWQIIFRPVPEVMGTPGTIARYWDTASTVAAVNAATTVGEIEDALDAMRVAYNFDNFGFTGITSLGSRSWTTPVIGDTNLKPAVLSVVDELAKYPPSFQERATFDGIIFTKNIINAEAPEVDIGGFANTTNTFLDIESVTSSMGMAYVFHHEYNHSISAVFSQYRKSLQAEWEALNPAGFSYLGSSYNDTFTGDWPEGFVRSYARHSYNEDLAETAASVFDTARQTLLAEQVAEDPIIAAKVNLIKEWYAKRSNQEISGQAYYTAIHTATGEEHSGSVTLSGGRTLNVTGAPGPTGTLALTGSRTLNVAGAPSWAGTLSLSGGRTLNLSGAPGQAGTLSLTGGRTFIPTGAPAIPGTVTLTGSRTLNLSGAYGVTGSLALGQARTLGVSAASIAITSTLSRTGTGALSGTGTAAITATLARTGTGSLSLPGTAQHNGTRSLGQTGALALSGSMSQTGTLGLGQTGALSGAGAPSVPGSLSRTGTGSLVQTGETSSAGSLSRGMVGSLSLAGSPGQSAALNIGQTGALTGTGTPAITGGLTRAIDSTLNLSGDGTVNASGEVTLTGTGATTVSGAPGATGAISLAGAGALNTATSTINLSGSAGMGMLRSLTLSGAPAIAAALSLTAVIGEALSGVPSIGGTLSRVGDGNVVTNQTAVTTGGALAHALTRSLTLVASAITTAGALNLTGTRSLILSGSGAQDGSGSFTMLGGRTLNLSGVPGLPGTLTRGGAGALGLSGAPGGIGALTLERTLNLTVAGVPAIVGELSIGLDGEVLIDGSPVVEGSLIIGGVGVLSMFGGSSNGEMFFKNGTRVQAFMLSGGTLVPVIPQLGE